MTDTEKVRKARKILAARKPAAEQLDDLLELLTGSRNTSITVPVKDIVS